MAAGLGTTYLGLDLPCPLVASASPLTGKLETLRELADAGAGAVVLPSLFEEELVEQPTGAADVFWEPGEEAGEAGAYIAPGVIDRARLDAHLDLVREASKELDVPVIASLNGFTPGGWTRFAELLQLAGASAIELNVYGVETDPSRSASAVEDRLLRLVRSVRSTVTVPLAVKLSPYYTAFAHLAGQLADARCDGLVLFNRFYQPNVDVSSLSVAPEIHLSTREELALPLRWIAILRGRVSVSLALTTGVHTGEDALKAILAGADVAMMTSALLLHGVGRMRDARASLASWLDLHGLPSVSAARGRLSQEACGNPRAYERAQYVQALRTVEPVSSD
jgi:dihydroorotate dehydrogenase (fumarate)